MCDNREGRVMDLGGWLRSLGLERYEAAFRENEIDETVLPSLTHDTLKEIGVTAVGHRLKLLDAIAALRTDTSAKPPTTSAVPSAPPEDRAERRQVTVMFSDLVGSTALSARMDPEDLREVISAYQKCVADAVLRFGGFVAKYMGDGVLVYFGYPQAHEDDAERAVRAGLELIAAVGALKAASPLQTRVGIATGLVVVGDLIGMGSAQEQAVVGETPNLAARLQGIAEPNSVVIAESTRKLLGNLFELDDLGARDLKGIAGPARAWTVLRTSRVESRFEALRTATTPLVGRDEEVDLLLRRWEQAKRGDGCVVLISGEPGIGKSRIAETIVERLGGEPHTRLRYFCSPHHQDSALYPSIAQLERAAGFRREDTAEKRLAKLEAVLAQGTNDLSEAVPLLADLLSIPTGDRYPPLELTPQKRKEKTLTTLVTQLDGLSSRQPVLVVYEDVHWSDPTTRESLDLLVDRVPTLRVMMILTFRPEFTPPWIGRPHVTLLTLNRLPRRQGAEMIAYVIGGKALPKEIAEQIIDRTDGVPLFIEELTKTVVESGIVTEVGDHYALAGPITPLAIPTSLHASLLARLDRLAPTREVAQIGAALGRSFSYELISAVAGVPQHKLDEALEQLASAELIFRRGIPPDAEYTFKHALVQEAAYSTLLRTRRQQLHGRVVTTLENLFPEVVIAQPALMAQHCGEAALSEKAVGYWLKAGQQAVARSAMTEAVAQSQKGLDLLTSLPDNSTRQQQELDLRITLGQALIATKGWAAPLVGETYARARQLAEELNRSDYLHPLLQGQGSFHLLRSELKLALSLAQQIEEIGKTRNDAGMLLAGCTNQGIICFYSGEFVTARDVLEQCYADPADRTAVRAAGATVSPVDLYSAMLVYIAMSLAYLGYVDAARARVREALSEASRLEHVYTLTHASLYAAWIECAVGSPNDIRDHAERAVSLASEHGFPFERAWGLIYCGWSMSALGEPEEGYAQVARGLSMHRATGSVLCTAFALTLLAGACGRLGRTTEGLGYLTEAEQLIETTNDAFHEAELHRVRGDLLNTLGDRAGAERSYQQAIAVAKRQSAKMFELRASTILARLWRDQGKRKEARDLLAPVYGWFTEGFDTLDLKEAEALLDELAS
jgi:class 3 adenylate cyclase/tetratricopeptide (TPR) repeat protein